jgi:aspartate aminotransferase
MFEEGEELKLEVGAENVFDFSLGNPMMEPPLQFKERLSEVVRQETPGLFKYTSSDGVYEARAGVAAFRAKDTGLPFTPEHIVMTCGAAGGYNVALKAILDPGDEVIIFVPYFVEYLAYIDNHGGIKVAVETDDEFGIDFARLEAAITVRTKAVIINSPNNPTGRVYDEEMMRRLGEMLDAKQK